MTSENQGYALGLSYRNGQRAAEKVYLKPMALYVPDVAARAVAELLGDVSAISAEDNHFILTVTNKNNGVSVDKDELSLAQLQDPTLAAEAVKALVNTVRGYESDEETNVCGW